MTLPRLALLISVMLAGPGCAPASTMTTPTPPSESAPAIVQIGAPVLRSRAAEVAPERIASPEIQQLITTMIAAMRDAPGVGLAAPQIGVPLRVFVYDCPDEELRQRRRGVVCNPVLETSERPETMPDPDDDEGCLSVPGEQGELPRPAHARVTGVDMTGRPVEIVGTGLLARCLQHEVDHLDGHLYIDRLDRSVRKKAMRAIRETL